MRFTLHREVVPFGVDDEGYLLSEHTGQSWYELHVRVPDWLGVFAFFVQRWR